MLEQQERLESLGVMECWINTSRKSFNSGLMLKDEMELSGAQKREILGR